MRNSGIGDTVIAEVLAANHAERFPATRAALKQNLDRLETHFKTSGRRREARAKLGYVLRDAATSTSVFGDEPERNVEWLEWFLKFLEAQQELAIAEPADYGSWLPEFMRDDPVAFIQAEMSLTTRQLETIRASERAARRAASDARLGQIRSAADLLRLPKRELAEIEAGYGLEPALGDRFYEPRFSDELG